MNAPVWRVEDDGDVLFPVSTTAEAGLVSLPFLVGAVRRKWRRVLATAAVCALLALGMVQLSGGQHAATVTLLLISDPSTDPAAAMATNLSLVDTRAVSEDVVNSQHLDLTPDAFASTVTAVPLSTQLMKVTVTAPSDHDALDRVNAFAAAYLTFRADQINAFATSTMEENRRRIADLNPQIADLTDRYAQASSTPGQEQIASTLLTQRTQLQAEVSAAEQAIADTSLQSAAVVDASKVIDRAEVVEKSRRKATVLAVLSGLIGGTALGLGLVLAPAILSTRLRRRDDVARALGLPVRFSAGRVRSRWWWLHARQNRRNAERLAHGVATALPEDAEPARLTVATIGDVRDGAFVIGALADELAHESSRVVVVDLSSSHALAKPSSLRLGRRDPIRNRQLVQVHRQGVRVSAIGSGTRTGAGSDRALDKAEVVLTLIELDLGAGVDVLGDLADTCIVLVSAGRASAERLRSSATLLRQSDIQPVFAMLVGADETDDSSGLLDRSGARHHNPARRSS